MTVIQPVNAARLLRQSRIKLDSQTLQENAQDEIKS
jgi:hypothetical protein